MLSLYLWNRGRRQHHGSDLAPNRKTLTPIAAPSHLRLARTSQADVSRLGRSWQSCSSCGSSSPAAQPRSGLPVRALRAAAAAALPEPPPVSPPPPRPVPPPSAPPPSSSACRLVSHSWQPLRPLPEDRLEAGGTPRPKRPKAGTGTQAPGMSGCVCPARWM